MRLRVGPRRYLNAVHGPYRECPVRKPVRALALRRWNTRSASDTASGSAAAARSMREAYVRERRVARHCGPASISSARIEAKAGPTPHLVLRSPIAEGRDDRSEATGNDMSSRAVEAARTGSVCGTTPQVPKGCSEGAGVPSGTVQRASVNSAHVMFTPPAEGRRAAGRLRTAAQSGQSSLQPTCGVGTPRLESSLPRSSQQLSISAA